MERDVTTRASERKRESEHISVVQRGKRPTTNLLNPTLTIHYHYHRT